MKTVTETVYEKVPVPAELLQECGQPELDDVQTTGDIEQALGEAIVSIAACNKDKARIGSWQESSNGE